MGERVSQGKCGCGFSLDLEGVPLFLFAGCSPAELIEILSYGFPLPVCSWTVVSTVGCVVMQVRLTSRIALYKSKVNSIERSKLHSLLRYRQ